MNLCSKIEEIIEKFNFDRVLQVMHYTHWTYKNSSNPVTKEDIQKMARGVLARAIDTFLNETSKNIVDVSLRGFVATCIRHSDREPTIMLTFEIMRVSTA